MKEPLVSSQAESERGWMQLPPFKHARSKAGSNDQVMLHMNLVESGQAPTGNEFA